MVISKISPGQNKDYKKLYSKHSPHVEFGVVYVVKASKHLSVIHMYSATDVVSQLA